MDILQHGKLQEIEAPPHCHWVQHCLSISQISLSVSIIPVSLLEYLDKYIYAGVRPHIKDTSFL